MPNSEYVEMLSEMLINAIDNERENTALVIRRRLESLGYEQDDDGEWVLQDEMTHAV